MKQVFFLNCLTNRQYERFAVMRQQQTMKTSKWLLHLCDKAFTNMCDRYCVYYVSMAPVLKIIIFHREYSRTLICNRHKTCMYGHDRNCLACFQQYIGMFNTIFLMQGFELQKVLFEIYTKSIFLVDLHQKCSGNIVHRFL